MKVEFPGYVGSAGEGAEAAQACAQLDADIEVPWVLLSASSTFAQFRTQLRIAAGTGACGLMAGRAIWGDGVGRHDAERRAAGARTAVEQLDDLHQVPQAHGRGWRTPVSVVAAVETLPADWHETY